MRDIEDLCVFFVDGDREISSVDVVFHLFDAAGDRIVEAPGNLDLGALEPALEGRYRATLRDGSEVEVEPAFVRLRRRLEDYAPEDASAICGAMSNRKKPSLPSARKIRARERQRLPFNRSAGEISAHSQ